MQVVVKVLGAPLPALALRAGAVLQVSFGLMGFCRVGPQASGLRTSRRKRVGVAVACRARRRERRGREEESCILVMSRNLRCCKRKTQSFAMCDQRGI